MSKSTIQIWSQKLWFFFLSIPFTWLQELVILSYTHGASLYFFNGWRPIVNNHTGMLEFPNFRKKCQKVRYKSGLRMLKTVIPLCLKTKLHWSYLVTVHYRGTVNNNGCQELPLIPPVWIISTNRHVHFIPWPFQHPIWFLDLSNIKR